MAANLLRTLNIKRPCELFGDLAGELQRRELRRRIFADNRSGPLTETLDLLDQPLVESLRAGSIDELMAQIGDASSLLRVLDVCRSAKDYRLIGRLLSLNSPDIGNSELHHRFSSAGFGGDPRDRHRWLVEYDVTEQRRHVIERLIRTVTKAEGADVALFVSLKEMELECLCAGAPIEAAKLHALILGSSNGCAPRPRSSGRQRPASNFQFRSPGWRALLHLARTQPSLVLEMAQRQAPDAFLASFDALEYVAPTYLIVSDLGYPMGGGESYMHQTCRLLSEYGISCVWLSFRDPLQGAYERDHFVHTPYYFDLGLAGGLQTQSIAKVVDSFRPDLIHAHSEAVSVAWEVASRYRITSLMGYHFWSGLVQLGDTGNRKMLANIQRHKLAPDQPSVSKGLVTRYVASEFMADVYRSIGGCDPLKVLYPLSDPSQFMVTDTRRPHYVLCLNANPAKGGEILLDCLRALGKRVDFMAVMAEADTGEYVDRLRAGFAEYPSSVLRGYGDAKELYRVARMVLVPTLVDETFCRVAYEAAMNGIPVLSTRNGFLPTLLGNAGEYLPEEPSAWIEAIDRLANDQAALDAIGRAQQEYVRQRFARDETAFADTALGLIRQSTRRNIGFFTIWGDQGLGNQVRHYARLLRQLGRMVHVFSFQAYASAGKSLTNQAEPREWSVPGHADSVYYSFNDRESVTVSELRQFVLANQIRTLIVPEICWSPNWQRLLELAVPGLATVSVPNVEIVVDREVELHNKLARTLYNTRLCEHVLRERGVRNGRYIGHGLGAPMQVDRLRERQDRLLGRGTIRFLHVAGHNPTIRKNTLKVLDAFAAASRRRSDIALTLTTMVDLRSFYSGPIPKSLSVISGNIPHAKIVELYDTHDVSIQPSSHEGLGLGFYESIAAGVPVISLDAPPHNEAVLDGKTGWLIPASAIPLPDNEAGLVPAWSFETSVLTKAILKRSVEEVVRVMGITADIHRARFDDFQFKLRLMRALSDL